MPIDLRPDMFAEALRVILDEHYYTDIEMMTGNALTVNTHTTRPIGDTGVNTPIGYNQQLVTAIPPPPRVRRTAEFTPIIAPQHIIDAAVDDLIADDLMSYYELNDLVLTNERIRAIENRGAPYTRIFMYNIKKNNSPTNVYIQYGDNTELFTNIRYGKYESLFDYISELCDIYYLNETDLFIAGGFITNQIINEIYKKENKVFDDVDIFCSNDIWKKLKEKYKDEPKFTSLNDVFSFLLKIDNLDEDIKIQFINKGDLTIERTLDSFDLNYSRMGYNKDSSFFIEKALLDEEFKILKGDNPLDKVEQKTANRIIKYYNRYSDLINSIIGHSSLKDCDYTIKVFALMRFI